MKKYRILYLVLLLLSGFSPGISQELSVENFAATSCKHKASVTKGKDTTWFSIKFTDSGAWCGFEDIKVDCDVGVMQPQAFVQLEGSNLTILHTTNYEAGVGFCFCYYDMTFFVRNLQEGDYHLSIYQGFYNREGLYETYEWFEYSREISLSIGTELCFIIRPCENTVSEPDRDTMVFTGEIEKMCYSTIEYGNICLFGINTGDEVYELLHKVITELEFDDWEHYERFNYTEPNNIFEFDGTTYTLGDRVEITGTRSFNHKVFYISSIKMIESAGEPNSIEPNGVAEAVLYPNPAREEITISTSGGPILQVEILDINGRVLHKAGNVNTERFTYNVSGFTKGTYLARVKTRNGVETLKFLRNN